MRIYDPNLVRKFMEKIRDDPTAEEIIIPRASEYEIFRYRREELFEGRSTGYFQNGIIYRNSKGRFTLVGIAVEDFNAK